ARRRQALAVGAEGQAQDAILMAGQGLHLPPRGYVPDLDVLLLAGCSQAPAVGAKCQLGKVLQSEVPAEGERDRGRAAQSLEVVPFPAAQQGRALVEQFLGPARVFERLLAL